MITTTLIAELAILFPAMGVFVEWSVKRHTAKLDNHLTERDKAIDRRFDLLETGLTQVAAETKVHVDYLREDINALNNCKTEIINQSR